MPNHAEVEPVAIVGIGCRLPGGINAVGEYWRFLMDGGEAIGDIPAERWAAYAANPRRLLSLIARSRYLPSAVALLYPRGRDTPNEPREWSSGDELGHSRRIVGWRTEGRGRMREYTRARWAPGQVVTLVVAGLFVSAAALDDGAGVVDTLVHLGFGLAGIAMSRTPRSAQVFLIGGGVTYVLLWQFGTLFDPVFVPLHTTNAIVHLSLFASMIGLAVLGGEATDTATDEADEPYRLDGVPARPRSTRSRPPGRADRAAPRRAPAARPGVLRVRGPGWAAVAA